MVLSTLSLLSKKFLTAENMLYLYKSTIRPSLEYCFRIWAGAPISSLNILNKVQARICNLIGDNLYLKLHPLSHSREVASLSLFYPYFHGHCSIIPKRYSLKNSSIQNLCSHRNQWAVYLPHRNTTTYSDSFIHRTASMWNSIPNFCFPSVYNLDMSKKNIHKYLYASPRFSLFLVPFSTLGAFRLQILQRERELARSETKRLGYPYTFQIFLI